MGAIMKSKLTLFLSIFILFFAASCSLGLDKTGSIVFGFPETAARTLLDSETKDTKMAIRIINSDGAIYKNVVSEIVETKVIELPVGLYTAEIEINGDGIKLYGKSEEFEVVAKQAVTVDITLEFAEEPIEPEPIEPDPEDPIITDPVDTFEVINDEETGKYRINIDLKTLLPGKIICIGDTIVLNITAKEFLPNVTYQLLPTTYSDGEIDQVYTLWDKYNTMYELPIEPGETARLPLNMVQLIRTVPDDNFEPIPDEAEFSVLQLFFSPEDFENTIENLSFTYSIEYHPAAEKYIEFIKSPKKSRNNGREEIFEYKCDYKFKNQQALGSNVNNISIKITGSSNRDEEINVWPIVMSDGEIMKEYSIIESKEPFGKVTLSNAIDYRSELFTTYNNNPNIFDALSVFQMFFESEKIDEPIYIKNFELSYATNKDLTTISDYILDQLEAE